MHSLPRIVQTFLVVVISFLLTGCQGLVFPLLTEQPVDVPPVVQAVASTDVADAQDTPDTQSDSNESDGNESNITVSDEPSDETLEATDAPDPPTANILVSSLRLRAGPGVDYDVLGAALTGEAFNVTGQAFNCQWLKGVHPTLGTVWFSGAAQYTSLNVGCDQVPQAEVPAAPVQSPTQPTATEAPVETTSVQPEQAGPPVEAATAIEPEPSQPGPNERPADQQPREEGCYTIQGYAGPALTVTITAIGRDWSTTVIFTGDSGQRYCFTPGPYTVTVVAPAIWKGMGTGFDVQPGTHNLSPADLLQ